MTGFKRVEENIDKTPQGRYRARYRDPQGKRRAKTFDRLTDARAFLKRKNGEVQRNEWTDPALAKRSFSEAARKWRSTWVDLKPKTKARYDSLLNTHALPAFGNVAVGKITKDAIQEYVADLAADDDIAAATIWRIVEVIRGPLGAAVEAGWLPRNPATKLKLPRKAEREMLFLTPQQVRDLAEAITPHYRTVIYLAAYTGLRAGEVWGLRVKDLDLLNGKLHIRQTLLEVDGKLAYDTPKNHAARTVYLPGFLREMIGADLARRDHSPPPANALVFVSAQGRPVHHSNFMRRHFRPAVKGRPESKRRRGTAGRPAIPAALPEELHGLRFHDLRHTAASIAAANGAQPKDVQRMLGHSSIQITMDRYTHLFPEHQEALAERMDAAYRESAPTPVAEVVALR